MLKLTKQELSIADTVIQEGRALVVVANKSDTLVGTPTEFAMGVKKQVRVATSARLPLTCLHLARQLDHYVPHLGDVVVVATSALEGQGVENVLPVVERVFEKWNLRVQTSVLNQWLTEVQVRAEKARLRDILHHRFPTANTQRSSQAAKAPPMVNGRRTKLKVRSCEERSDEALRLLRLLSEEWGGAKRRCCMSSDDSV